MAFQDANGQWYDDNYNQIADPGQQNYQPTPSGFGGKGTAPNGVPDPNHPGLDTAGWPLASTPNSPGNVITKNPDGSTTIANSNVNHPPPEPGPTSWQNLSQSAFGNMPGVPNATPFEYDAFDMGDPFKAPTGQDALDADPGYAFRLSQGTGAMQNSAAARGVLNTGGTLQDLVNYGQGAASQEYGNAYNRALGTYQTNFGDRLNAYTTNFGGALARYNTNYGTQYLNPYNQMFQQYQQGVGNQGQLFGQQFQTATA